MKTRLACLLVVAACASSTDGPTPVIASVTPDPICDAQQAMMVTIAGSGFSPIVQDGLTDHPSVVVPTVRLVGTTTVEVPAADVGIPDVTGTKLVITIEQGTVTPGTYDVEVIDPDGHGGTLTGGLVSATWQRTRRSRSRPPVHERQLALARRRSGRDLE